MPNLKPNWITHILILTLGFLLGSMTIYLTSYSEKQENTTLFAVLAKNNPILPLKEYTAIMSKSDGSTEDLVKAYAHMERATYYMNVFSSTSGYVPTSEFETFRGDYDKIVNVERFREIIDQFDETKGVQPEELAFLKEQADRFNQLPTPSMEVQSFEEYFYSVRNAFETIK
ncbi:hypothetical protein [Brevibacillus dissolubilis]|uniref:hypothetical protein n=1 Tax=Brevibacillus dissolubilis TaxID=1844116 RepID=UPI0011171D3A|nr:hypothetical protein [Brevibacillus dissolubilis]